MSAFRVLFQVKGRILKKADDLSKVRGGRLIKACPPYFIAYCEDNFLPRWGIKARVTALPISSRLSLSSVTPPNNSGTSYNRCD